jgi:anti-sigma factor RsiW
MPTLGCLWNRPHLEQLVDGALGARRERMTTGHVSRCAACWSEVERLQRLRSLVRSAQVPVADPDWSGFWPTIRVRIASGTAQPVREAWWLPLWKPVWGHPRMALGGLVVSTLAVALMLWSSPETTVSTAVAAPIQVQDVSTADPDRSVMVYSNPDDEVTVIWVFNPAEPDEQS